MRLASHEIKKIELSAKCTDELICKLASGKAEWSMSVPPQDYDTDKQLIREVRKHIPNLIKHISIIEDENERLREALHRIRHHVVGFKSNSEIISEIDEALGEVGE